MGKPRPGRLISLLSQAAVRSCDSLLEKCQAPACPLALQPALLPAHQWPASSPLTLNVTAWRGSFQDGETT